MDLLKLRSHLAKWPTGLSEIEQRGQYQKAYGADQHGTTTGHYSTLKNPRYDTLFAREREILQ